MGAELAGAVAGPLVSSALGGGGSDAMGNAVNAQVQGAGQASASYAAAVQKALAALNTTFGEAKSNINDNYATARDQYSPYNFGGLTAYDRLMGASGLPTLPGGSFSLQQSLSLDRSNKQAIQAQADAKNSLTNDLQNYVNARFVPGTAFGTVTQMQPKTLQQLIDEGGGDLAKASQGAINDIGSVNDPITLNGGYFKSFGQYGSALQKDLDAYNAPVKTTALTADQQKIVDAYNNGTLGQLQTYDKNQATGDFLNSPEYQLLFNQGGATTDPNATVLDRFRASPGYQFSVDEGVKARDASAAAKGMLLSGNQLRDLQTFGTGVADQEFNGYQDRITNTFGNYYNRLMGITGLGANAASANANLFSNQGNQLAAINTNLGTQQSQLYQGQGTVDANAALAAANAMASGYAYDAKQDNQFAGAIGNGLTNFLGGSSGQNFLGNIFGSSSSSGSNTSAANSGNYSSPAVPTIGDSLPYYLRSSSYG